MKGQSHRLPEGGRIDRGRPLRFTFNGRQYGSFAGDTLASALLANRVSVVGRGHPEWGEEVAAFVVPKPGSTVTEGELDTLCLDNIARYKRPRTYRFIDALPKNNYGKVLKTELREQLHQESGGDGGQ